MAFVFRSEKVTELDSTKNKFDTGPGQYLPQTERKQVKSAKVPFGVGDKKKFLIAHNNVDVPGPGSYYQDEMLNKFNKTFHKTSQQFNPKDYMNLNTFEGSEELSKCKVKRNIEYLGFLSKNKRFKEKCEEKTPGPGHYIKSIQDKNEFTEEVKIFNFKKISHPRNVLKCEKGKVISIPNKDQGHGYEFDEEGKNLLKDDPEFFKRHKGIKKDTVGPGNYELDKPNLWLKKGTKWSKSVTTKIAMDKLCNNTCHNQKLSKSFEKDFFTRGLGDDGGSYSDTERKKINFQKINNNSNTLRKQNRKELNKLLMKKEPVSNMQAMERRLITETPGPGYYYQERAKSSIQGKKSSLDDKQNFLSNLQRFEENTSNNQVGPGSYFKSDKINMKKVQRQTFSKSKALAFFEKNNFDNPGPGYYESGSEFKKPPASAHYNFGTLEKRFVDHSKQIQNATPGPGAYDNNSTMNTTATKWTGNKHKDLKHMTLHSRAATSEMKQRPKKSGRVIEGFNPREDVPAVGSYNPDTIFSIDYKVKKANSKMSLIEAPFNLTYTSKRFYNPNENEFANLGPGYYFKNNKTVSAQVYPPFKANESRFNEKRKDVNLGPGIYNKSSYFEWNKKTYNILYL